MEHDDWMVHRITFYKKLPNGTLERKSVRCQVLVFRDRPVEEKFVVLAPGVIKRIGVRSAKSKRVRRARG